MALAEHVVMAQSDETARVWFVKASDIPGLFVEAETLEAFTEVVADLAPDLLDLKPGDAGVGIRVTAEALATARAEPA